MVDKLYLVLEGRTLDRFLLEVKEFFLPVWVPLTQSSGGYGEPFERDPERVLADCLSGVIDADAARADYGVVLDLAERRVDVAATRQARTARSRP